MDKRFDLWRPVLVGSDSNTNNCHVLLLLVFLHACKHYLLVVDCRPVTNLLIMGKVFLDVGPLIQSCTDGSPTTKSTVKAAPL